MKCYRSRIGIPLLLALPFLTCCTDPYAAQLGFDSPTGGEVFIQGKTYTIRLNAKLRAKSFRIEISTDGGATFQPAGIIDNAVLGRFQRNTLVWNVTQPASSNCVFRAIPTPAKEPVLELDSAPFSIAQSTLTTPGTTVIADGSVTSASLAPGAVTNTSLAPGAVTSDKVSSGPASASSVLAADGSGGTSFVPILSLGIAPSGLAGGDLTGFYPDPLIAPLAVTSGKLADGAVSSAKIADGAVGSLKLADGAVSAVKLSAGAVDATALADGSVGTAKLADGGVTATKLAAGAVGAAALADASVGTTKLANGGVTTAKLAAGAVDSAALADASVGTTKLADGGVTAAKLAAGAVGATALADGAVGTAKLADGGVTTAKLAAGAVGATALLDGSVGTTKLADGGVTAAKLAAGAVDATALADGAVGTAKLADGGVTAAKLAAGAVGATALADGAVGTAKLADGGVTAAKLAAGAVDATALADGAVGTAKLANASVDLATKVSGQLPDANLATISGAGKVADSALSPNVALLNSSPVFSGTVSAPGYAESVTTVTASLTLTAAHGTVLCNAGLMPVVVSLPAAAGNAGRRYTVKAINVLNLVSVQAQVGETIDGSLLPVPLLLNNSLSFASNGTGWFITGQK